jgi:transcriptional regulator with XRE-family HTH domain
VDTLKDALRTIREARGLSLYQAGKATGVPQGNLGKMEDGTYRLTYRTLYEIVSGYKLSKEETTSLFLLLIRDRMLDHAEDVALWLFLSIADGDALERIAGLMNERGYATSPPMVGAVLMTIAERAEYAEVRRWLAPLILRSLTVSLAAQTAWVAPGDATEQILSDELALVKADVDIAD